MSRKESLQNALANYTARTVANKMRMKITKEMHPLTWFLRPTYWKAERDHYHAFRNLIFARRMIATDEANEAKERARG